jgi:hypothetical protein
MKKKKSKNFTSVLTSILITFAIYTGALGIFLYVQGWRFDFTDQSLKQVGVLTVESSPTLANIYVNEEYKGRTTKSMTLDTGTYDVKVTKDGYYDWNKNVRILEEKSTPIFPYLIKTEFESENIFTSKLTLEDYWADETNNHLLLLLKDTNSYQLVHYDINTGFWALNSAPNTILTISDDKNNPITNIDLLLSPSGEMAILTLITEDSNNKYLMPTTRTTNYSTLIKEPLDLSGFKNFETSWSNDGNFLMLESKEDVVSYDLDKNTKNLLLRKSDPLDVWSTDKDGYFYIFRHLKTSSEDLLQYSLTQYHLDGSAQTPVIPTVYFQNSTDYIENYRTKDFTFGFFTNSPENTQAIGKITDFTVNQDVDGVFITTTQSSYWYDSTIGKYKTITPYPAKILEFAPDQDKVLIKTDTNYLIFIFDKEEGDHTISLGTHNIENIIYDQINKINWLSNSSYFQLEEDDFIYILDKDGDNKTPILNTESVLYWTITASRDNLILLTNSEDKGLMITSYTIH